MKRFEFSLGAVLAFKQKQEKLAEAEQRRALAVLHETQEEIQRIKDQLCHVAESVAQRMLDGIELTMWVAFNRKSGRLGQNLKDLEQKERAASQKLEQTNALRKKITVEVEALLTLRRQQWQAYRRLVERKSQEYLDELGLRRWQTGSKSMSADAEKKEDVP